MGYAKAKHFDPRLIPVIDIAPLSDGTDPIGVSKALHKASQNTGFIYIKGHGMSDITIDNARATALKFFRSKETEKSLVSVTDKHRGWLGPNRSKMRDDVKSDLKESFIWGLENKNSNLSSDLYVYGANKWPKFLPEMREDERRLNCELGGSRHWAALPCGLVRCLCRALSALWPDTSRDSWLASKE